MPPDIDMIGEQDLEAMELQIGSWACGVHRGSQRHRRIGRTNGQTVWHASGSPGPPNHPRAHLHHPFHRGSPHAGQPTSSPGGSETRETDAQSFLHASIAATQLSNCQKSAYPLCVWHLGKGWQTRERGHRLDRAIGHGSRQTRLPL